MSAAAEMKKALAEAQAEVQASAAQDELEATFMKALTLASIEQMDMEELMALYEGVDWAIRKSEKETAWKRKSADEIMEAIDKRLALLEEQQDIYTQLTESMVKE